MKRVIGAMLAMAAMASLLKGAARPLLRRGKRPSARA
jgi:hypothetical protein